jgi:hypothetical protein
MNYDYSINFCEQVTQVSSSVLLRKASSPSGDSLSVPVINNQMMLLLDRRLWRQSVLENGLIVT